MSYCSMSKNLVKQIINVLDPQPLITTEMFEVIKGMVEAYNLRIIDIIHLIIPAQIRNGKIKQQTTKMCYLTQFGLSNLSSIRANSKNQILACAYLKTKIKEDIVILNKKFGNATITKLIEKGYIAFDIVGKNANLLINSKEQIFTEYVQST